MNDEYTNSLRISIKHHLNVSGKRTESLQSMLIALWLNLSRYFYTRKFLLKRQPMLLIIILIIIFIRSKNSEN